MATRQRNSILGQLRRAALLHAGDVVTDGQLLERFITERDEDAFAALVQRHGPMVLGVCRRILGHHHDAEDAFQVTFVVLARKAVSISQRELLGNWLYGTAYRAALEAKALRRRVKETQVGAMPESVTVDVADEWTELRPLLDAELNRLPEKYRMPVVLCDLEGHTHRAAARLLGIPEGTLSGRLTTARRTLARRLSRHGLTLTGAIVATILSQSVDAVVLPTGLVTSTSQAAFRVAAGSAAATVLTAEAAALLERVMRTMLLTKLKLAALGLMLALTAAYTIGYANHAAALAQPLDDKKTLAEPKPQENDLETANWTIQATLTGHKDRVESLSYSRDGKLLATADWNGKVKIWDVATGKNLVTLEGHEGEVNKAVFAPDGKQVATAGADRTVRIWEVAKGTEVQKMLHNDPVHCVAFTPDGKTLLAAGGKIARTTEDCRGELRVWDPATGKEKTSVAAGHTSRISHLAFTPDGKSLVTGGADNAVKLWDWDGKDQLKQRHSVAVGKKQGVFGLALAPDGKSVAVTTDGSIKLYDVTTGAQKKELEKSEYGAWDDVTFTPDGKTVLANSWQVDTKQETSTTQRSIIRLWDVTTGKVAETFEIKKVIESVAFSPDGKKLVLGGRGVHKLVATDDGRVLPDLTEESKDGPVLLLVRKKVEKK